MMGKMDLSRRGFLSLSAGTGFTLGFGVLPALGAAAPGFGPWIRIAPDGMVTALTNVSDIGQGTNSALAQAVAEELAVPLALVRMEMAPVEKAFHNKSIGNYAVYGSIGLRTNLRPLRLAAAGARQMLAEAAATRFGVPMDQVVMRDGQALHAASGRSLPYTALLADAAKLSPPAEPKLTPRTAWKVLGQPLPRQDIPGKVDGSTVYGLDVRLPGMLTAVVTPNSNVPHALAAPPEQCSSLESLPGIIARASNIGLRQGTEGAARGADQRRGGQRPRGADRPRRRERAGPILGG